MQQIVHAFKKVPKLILYQLKQDITVAYLNHSAQ